MANWAANFVVTVSLLTLLSAIGGVGAFSSCSASSTLVALAYFGARSRRPRAAACRRLNATWYRTAPNAAKRAMWTFEHHG